MPIVDHGPALLPSPGLGLRGFESCSKVGMSVLGSGFESLCICKKYRSTRVYNVLGCTTVSTRWVRGGLLLPGFRISLKCPESCPSSRTKAQLELPSLLEVEVIILDGNVAVRIPQNVNQGFHKSGGRQNSQLLILPSKRSLGNLPSRPGPRDGEPDLHVQLQRHKPVSRLNISLR